MKSYLSPNEERTLQDQTTACLNRQLVKKIRKVYTNVPCNDSS